MAYERMKDEYMVNLYVQAYCPKCGFLMQRGNSGKTMKCDNPNDCEMANIILESPRMKVKRFVASPGEFG
jgi:hypothetical protein